MEERGLVLAQQAQVSVMPAMSIRDAIDRHKQMVGFVKEIMRPGTDFGVIPGTGTKPVLYKPGAEKLTTFFGLVPRFVVVEKTEDWGSPDHEALFYYWIKCELYRSGQIVGEADGSCSSREGKYRYRKSGRVCPACGAGAIKKSKYPPRGDKKAPPGWYCYSKIGGCGAEFAVNDTTITGQVEGRLINEDVADLVNTILKMAQKRALVAATLITVNASEFFTQDLEDTSYGDVIDGHFAESEHQTPAEKATEELFGEYQHEGANTPSKPAHWIESDNVRKRFWAYTRELTLSRDDVHAALGIEHIMDFAGTMQDAKAAIQAYISTKIAEADDKEAQEPPVEELDF